MTFERLTIGDAIAWIAALALLLFTAVDWYSTVQGNEARQIQHDVAPSNGALGGEVQRDIQEQASLTAQADEKNLWQEKRAIDRLELLLILGAALSASVAAICRVAGKRFKGWLTPSALAAMLSAAAALLMLYRLGNQPGNDQVTTLKSGVWLAFAAVGLLCLGASLAWRAERNGTAWRGEEPASQPAAEPLQQQ
jgi:hypothetical protein